MCTVVILRRPGHDWPLIVAANRDELVDRPWSPPDRHWPDREDVVGGLDHEAGGSWLGLNDAGVVSSILNRRHSLGPAIGKRSRGELVLDALDHADASDAAEALGTLDPAAYRAFNLLIADDRDAFWLRSLGETGGRIDVAALGEGVSILTAHDVNDRNASDRTRYYLPRFEAANPPDPDAEDWSAWQSLLASTESAPGVTDANGAMRITTEWGFATVSSSLLALPSPERKRQGAAARWLFSTTWPGLEPFRPVAGL